MFENVRNGKKRKLFSEIVCIGERIAINVTSQIVNKLEAAKTSDHESRLES